jgi:hypothetical protein
VPKSKGGVRYPILQDVHIQWLVGKLHSDLDFIVESLHHHLNEVFQFPRLVSISCVSRTMRSRARFTLELMRYEPNDHNNETSLIHTNDNNWSSPSFFPIKWF